MFQSRCIKQILRFLVVCLVWASYYHFVDIGAATAATLFECTSIGEDPLAECRRLSAPNLKRNSTANNVVPAAVNCDIEFVSEDLSSNRWNSLPLETLQAVVYYIGDTVSGEQPQLKIEVRSANGEDVAWISMGGDALGGPIDRFDSQIETREYLLGGCVPTGRFTVSGVTETDGLAGLAFGLYWKHVDGYRMLKSNSLATVAEGGASFVSAFPLNLTDTLAGEYLPQLSDGFAHTDARTILYGAKLLGNGHHHISLPEPVLDKLVDAVDPPPCEVKYITEALTSNQNNALKSDTLQIAVVNAGLPSSTPLLRIELINPINEQRGWIAVGEGYPGDEIVLFNDLNPLFNQHINTREYHLDGCEPTGRTIIKGVIPSSVAGGIAFGMLWKNVKGDYQVIRSNADETFFTQGATYVGAWPLGLWDAWMCDYTPQLDQNGRETTRMLISGAKLLADGVYQVSVWNTLCQNPDGCKEHTLSSTLID